MRLARYFLNLIIQAICRFLAKYAKYAKYAKFSKRCLLWQSVSKKDFANFAYLAYLV
jgi:hypothetical protein